MNGVLIEAFRHNSWATKSLLAFCGDLSQEQLEATVTGSFGGILVTFNHLVRSEASYLRRLSGSGPDWIDTGNSEDLNEITRWVDETQQRWEKFLSQPIDAEQIYQVDDGLYAVRAGIIVTQALHHGNVHREQISAILTSLGKEPPDIQPWEYAWETGRIWEITG